MSNKKYSGYLAIIYAGDDAPYASAKGEDFKNRFPGADYEVVTGSPCRQCQAVSGYDEQIKQEMMLWINSTG